jgi:hypothetical protein
MENNIHILPFAFNFKIYFCEKPKLKKKIFFHFIAFFFFCGIIVAKPE